MPRARDGRAAIRQEERSKLVIKGVDTCGVAFEEKTETRDISEAGLSFFLSHPLWLNSPLTAEVGSSSLFPSSHVTRAVVMRIQTEPSGKQFVAVRFNE